MTTQPVAPPKSHDWVRWTVQGVVVIAEAGTGVFTVLDEPSSAVGEQVACQDCGEPLTGSSAASPCRSEELEPLSP